jgi:hypothetical protein
VHSEQLQLREHSSHTSSTTHLYVGTFTVSVRRTSFVFVYICAKLARQSYQKNRFGSLHTFDFSASLPQFWQTQSQCSQVGHPGPATQNGSHLQPQHTTSTFFSSQTSRHTFLQGASAPQRAHFDMGLAAPIRQHAVNAINEP